MGFGSKPSIILGIGFIQIESVKSVVKNSGVWVWLRHQPRQAVRGQNTRLLHSIATATRWMIRG
jgi:ribosomal protein S13